jgi:formate--tetrahydrofolate ligase
VRKIAEEYGALCALSEHWLKGGDGVTHTDEAKAKLDMYEADPKAGELGICMVKTHLRLSHDPDLKGAPKGWELPISDTLCYKGAGFLVPVAGVIKLMPGTCSDPAFRRIDVDVKTGKVKGLF